MTTPAAHAADAAAPSRATMLSTLSAFLASYTDAVRHKDAAILSNALAPGCTRHIVPSGTLARAFPALAAALEPGPGGEAREAYEARMAGEIAGLERAETRVLEPGGCTVDVEARRVVARVEHLVVSSRGGGGGGRWREEDDDGAGGPAEEGDEEGEEERAQQGGEGGKETRMEFVWFLDLSADGRLVERVTQFVDTLVSARFLETLLAAQAAGG